MNSFELTHKIDTLNSYKEDVQRIENEIKAMNAKILKHLNVKLSAGEIELKVGKNILRLDYYFFVEVLVQNNVVTGVSTVDVVDLSDVFNKFEFNDNKDSDEV